MREKITGDGEKGQVYTLEAFAASFLLLLAVLFAIQSSAITTIAESTSTREVEKQQQYIAQGVLETTDEPGDLRKMVLYWDINKELYHNSGDNGVYDVRNSNTLSDALPNNEFGDTVNTFMLDEGIAANVNIVYYTENSDGTFSQESRSLITMGTPSENAFTASKTIPLFDDDTFVNEDNSSSGQKLKENEEDFYIKDVDPSSNTYNLVRVEIITWEI